MNDYSEWEIEQRAAAEDAVRAVFPDDVATKVVECDAFGAVVGRLFRAHRVGEDREEVLAALDADTVAAALKMDTPGAFIASRIPF